MRIENSNREELDWRKTCRNKWQDPTELILSCRQYLRVQRELNNTRKFNLECKYKTYGAHFEIEENCECITEMSYDGTHVSEGFQIRNNQKLEETLLVTIKEKQDDNEKIRKQMQELTRQKSSFTNRIMQTVLNKTTKGDKLKKRGSSMREPLGKVNWKKFMIAQDSFGKQIWEILIVIILLYTLISLPVKVVFLPVNDPTAFTILIDILFFIDIILTFLTTYTDHRGNTIYNPWLIAKRYAKTWLILDILATFPFYLIEKAAIAANLNQFLRFPRLLKLIRLMRLAKLGRAYRLIDFLNDLKYTTKCTQTKIRMIKVLCIVTIFGHFCACTWYFIGTYYDNIESGEDGWPMRYFDEADLVIDSPVVRKYLISFYWSIQAITTEGLGDITGENDAELSFSIFAALSGATIFSYITATVSSILYDIEYKGSIYRNKMYMLQQLLKSSKIKDTLREKLMDEMSALWKSEVSMYESKNLMDEIPRGLRKEVAIHRHFILIYNSRFFRPFLDKGNHIFISDLATKLIPRHASAGETLGSINFPVEVLNIVAYGIASARYAFDSKIEVESYKYGDSFGEVGIFITKRWPWNIIALEDTLLYTIGIKKLLHAVSPFQEACRILVDIARDRIVKAYDIKRENNLINSEREYILNRCRDSIVNEKFSTVFDWNINHCKDFFDTEEAYDEDLTDPDRNTAKGRWRFISRRVVGHDHGIFRTFRRLVKTALCIQRYSMCLEELNKDLERWKIMMGKPSDDY